MGSLNKVQLIGNLGQDPTVRYTKAGQAVASFSIATSEKYTNKAGEKVETTEWHRIVAWGKLGEICGEYLSKRKQVYIEGRLQTREWEDKDGGTKQTTEIVASTMTMLGQVGSQGAGPGDSSSDSGASDSGDELEDEDIPF